GPEILPVLWADNYFSLLPGESREIVAQFTAKEADGAKPTLEIGGWNIESKAACTALDVSPQEIHVGMPAIINATIASTFLDGSRVVLRQDGLRVGSGWAWARNGSKDQLAFPINFEHEGKHVLEVEGQKLEVNVRP
ncbi:MAG TPA: hypothetical protein VKY92_26285, partial [Verrucomicrobiae bacterium]|nr:hypothetical protein [Verrucomicrobiae bacterium]